MPGQRKREADDHHDDLNNTADTKIQKYNYTIKNKKLQIQYKWHLRGVFSDGRLSTFMNYTPPGRVDFTLKGLSERMIKVKRFLQALIFTNV